MSQHIRRQLTLFVQEIEAQNIEKIRTQYNPIQSALIKSHVTLCREDEIENLEAVLENLATRSQKTLAIHFGQVVRFEASKGVLMPALGNQEAFQELRRQVLKGVIDQPRIHEPHLTLMHPRNSICTDAIFEAIQQTTLPAVLHFRSIALIEQEHGGAWRTLFRENDF